jgi:hypothetical protein
MKMLKYLLPLCLLAAPCSAQSGQIILPTIEAPLKLDDLRPEDIVMGFMATPAGKDWPETVLTLHADGSVEYGPAWSPENFYRAVCASRHFGDCI